jgi:hypothetical protein
MKLNVRVAESDLGIFVRTRMYGGVAGQSGRPLPLCRYPSVLQDDLHAEP